MAYVNNSEPGGVLTRPNNVYTSLDKYNEKSIFGPPLSPIIPSMQYIQLPIEHTNYGYEALSHDYNGVGYYTVESGYGNKCTSFATAKCPRNEIIGVHGGRGPAPAPAPAPAPIKEMYSDPNTINNLSELAMVIYVDQAKCDLCKEMVRMCEENNLYDQVMIKDISDKRAKDEMISRGGRGVPFTYSESTGKSVTGLPPDVNTLVHTLVSQATHSPVTIPPALVNKIRSLDLVIYTSDDCDYCKHYRNFLEQHNLLPYVTIIDINNENHTRGDAYLKTHQLPGYPFTYSKTLKTSFPGAVNNIDEIIYNLTNQTT